jgi:hypothetical protein
MLSSHAHYAPWSRQPPIANTRGAYVWLEARPILRAVIALASGWVVLIRPNG